MASETVSKTVAVAVGLCVVCSIAVSSAAVALKGTIDTNKVLDKKKNILIAASIIKKGAGTSKDEIQKLYKEKLVVKAVDLKTGKFTDKIDVAKFDARQAIKNATKTIVLKKDQDIAKIRVISKTKIVYLVKDGDKISKIIVPFHGKGLWSTMYGFLVLDAKTRKKVEGIAFYEHGETPGLGGEIENPLWQKKWLDKIVYDDNFNVKLSIIKGSVNPTAKDAKYKIDGLSGATLTANGVDATMKFWLGQNGFAPFLKNLSLNTPTGSVTEENNQKNNKKGGK